MLLCCFLYKSFDVYNITAHLNQHYNEDEDGKLGHGSAISGYDNVRQLCVSAVAVTAGER